MMRTYCNPEELPLLLRITDLMCVLNVGRNTAYNLVNSGQVQSIRVGTQIRIPKEAVLAFMSCTESCMFS